MSSKLNKKSSNPSVAYLLSGKCVLSRGQVRGCDAYHGPLRGCRLARVVFHEMPKNSFFVGGKARTILSGLGLIRLPAQLRTHPTSWAWARRRHRRPLRRPGSPLRRSSHDRRLPRVCPQRSAHPDPLSGDGRIRFTQRVLSGDAMCPGQFRSSGGSRTWLRATIHLSVQRTDRSLPV
jgi:hypothetical protein